MTERRDKGRGGTTCASHEKGRMSLDHGGVNWGGKGDVVYRAAGPMDDNRSSDEGAKNKTGREL